MNHSTRPLHVNHNDPAGVYRETHRRRAALFASVFSKLARLDPNMKIKSVEFERVEETHRPDGWQIFGPAPRRLTPAGDDARATRRLDLVITFRDVNVRLACRYQQEQSSWRRPPQNRLVLWYGDLDFYAPRGIGGGTRKVEPKVGGFDVSKVVYWIASWAEEHREAVLAAQQRQRQRIRQRREREQRLSSLQALAPGAHVSGSTLRGRFSVTIRNIAPELAERLLPIVQREIDAHEAAERAAREQREAQARAERERRAAELRVAQDEDLDDEGYDEPALAG